MSLAGMAWRYRLTPGVDDVARGRRLCQINVVSNRAKRVGTCGETDMSAYFVLTQTVTDPQTYSEEFISGGPAGQGRRCSPLPSEQAIRDLLDDPAYQPLKKRRLSITVNANAVVAP